MTALDTNILNKTVTNLLFTAPNQVCDQWILKKDKSNHSNNFKSDSPVPPPILLEEYEKIQQGMTNRIMTMAESEMSHRHQWEKNVLIAQKTDVKRASWLGFIIAIASLLAACFCAYINQPLIAILLLIPPTSGVMLAIPRIIKSNLGNNHES
ncbi:MAG: DUF2335 domain-containing protein [Paracoccaceae bacterium]|nr:DUF2335 domain-containing protein [Paracoccaceae bacterium]MDE2916476.1 DUF2335 domain-containing protein [Paracoccaceae bacterium]